MSGSRTYYRYLTASKILEADMIKHMDKEPQICSHFGCGRKLSMEEKLHGNKCFNHSIEQKPDITQFIKIRGRRKV